MSSMTENSDPYLNPGANVPKNLRDLTDPNYSNDSKHAGRTDCKNGI